MKGKSFMPRNRFARKEFFSSYVNILFLVLSLIQGLAFQDLAQKARIIIPALWGDTLLGSTQAWIQICYTTVCFAILLRILQTYITVALDYGPKYVTLHDILVVFIVGLIEAFLFNELGDTDLVKHLHPGHVQDYGRFINPVRFWIAMLSMSTVASIIYFLNVTKVAKTEPKFLSRIEEREEQILQSINSLCMLILAVLSIFLIHKAYKNGGNLSDACSLEATSFCILVLIGTTAFSLSNTFGIRAVFTNDVNDVVKHDSLDKSSVSKSYNRNNMTAHLAHTADITFIRDNCCKKLEYRKFFGMLFGVSDDRVEEILSEFIRTDDANSFLSFSYWIIVSATIEPSVGHKGSSKKDPIGCVFVYSKSSSQSPIVAGLGKAIAKRGWLRWLAYCLFPNMRRPFGGYSKKYACSHLGPKGAEHLQAKIDEFAGPELGKEEIRIRFAASIPEANEEDVIDCVLNELSGEGSLSGIILPDDEGLEKTLRRHGLKLAQHHVTINRKGEDKVRLLHFR